MNTQVEALQGGAKALKRGDAAGALASAERVLASEPRNLEALVLAGQALQALGRPDKAAEHLEAALELAPRHVGLLSNLSALQLALGEFEHAAGHARRAAALAPDHFGAQLNLGLALLAARDYEESARALEKALELKPDHAQALRGLAKARYRAGRAHASAQPLLQKASALFPEDHELKALLADSLVQIAAVAEGVAMYRELLDPAGDLPAADRERYNAAYLLSLQYLPETTPADLLHAHEAWAAGLPGAKHLAPSESGEDRLRIGWLSPRFGPGPVASFLLPVLGAFDRGRTRHYLYASRKQGGAINDRFRALADEWRELDGLAEREAAERIAADQLDVLVDLAGHAPGGALRVMRYRPAALQASWLDSFCTTGLPEMDLFITDDVLTPEEDERWYSERVARLPGGRLCYRPPLAVPEPSQRRGEPVVFASFNRLSKLGSPVLQAWGRILEAVPEARLRIRNSAFEDHEARRDFEARCRRAGLDPERLSLHGYCSYAEIMADYGDVDIALDPFPFSGCTTTCDALWMGVPVVTRSGDTLVSRQSASILHHLGHPEWVTRSGDEYVDAAVTLAGDQARRRTLRASLRDEMQSAFVPRAFARELLTLFRRSLENR